MFLHNIKRYSSVFCLTLMSLLFFAVNSSAADLPSVYKAIPPEYTTPVVPNVLLLLDTSGSMLFDSEDDETKGDGSRPYKDQLYYGRDTVSSNNDPDDFYSYYPPLKYMDSYDTSTLGTNRLNYMFKNGYIAKNGSKYLYPNDSRFYTLKLVLWNIFTDLSLVQGLNVGLSTYYQEEDFKDPGYTYSYYSLISKNSGWYWDSQKISWQPTNDEKALLRIPFDVVPQFSYSESDFVSGVPAGEENKTQWYKLLSLIDGKETSSNPELRGIGGTPLEKSIYREKSEGSYERDTEGDYVFLPKINKYVIIPGDSGWHNEFWYNYWFWKGYSYQVKNDKIKIRWKEWQWQRGWKWYESEYPLSEYRYTLSGGELQNFCAASFLKPEIKYPCQQNWLIVLTDGEDSDSDADPAEAVKKLYQANELSSWKLTDYDLNPQPVRTFVIGLIDKDDNDNKNLVKVLDKMAYEGRTWEVISKDEEVLESDVHAFYANDTASLLDSFRSIFQAIQDANSSTIPAEVDFNGLTSGDIYTYTSSFSPETDGAWPGYLYKKSIINNKTTTVWDARSLLAKRDWESRAIYYVPWWNDVGSSAVFWGGNLHYFNDSDETIKTNAGFDDDYKTFINWIKGSNWNNDETRDNILFDNYMGDICMVGAPPGFRSDDDFNDFAYENKDRKSVLYSQGNDGMLHAFDESNGKELWAFIPPNVLHSSRLAGLKGSSGSENLGYSRYLLAGSLDAEDLTVDGAYRTVLLGTLGRGGAGLYALDISDADKPDFLWAFDSEVYGENSFNDSDEVNLLWREEAGTISLSSNSDMPDLRHVTGYPFIGWADGCDDWIALLGAGYGDKEEKDGDISFTYKKDSGGKAVYAVSMEDGSLVRAFTNNKMGEVTASVAVPSSSVLAEYLKISLGYVGDSLGNIWKMSFDGDGSREWSMKQIFESKKSEKSPSIQYALDLSVYMGHRWVFAATGNLDGLFERDSSKLPDNYIVALKDPSDGKTVNITELEDLDKDLAGSYMTTDNDYGWSLNLGTDEQASMAPIIYRGLLFAATYNKSGDNPCSSGSSNFYILDAFTGKGRWAGGAKYSSLSGIKIMSMVAAGDKLFVSIMNPAGKKVEDLGLPPDMSPALDSEGALLTLTIPEHMNTEIVEESSRSLKSTYWRRIR